MSPHTNVTIHKYLVNSDGGNPHLILSPKIHSRALQEAINIWRLAIRYRQYFSGIVSLISLILDRLIPFSVGVSNQNFKIMRNNQSEPFIRDTMKMYYCD